MKVIESLNNKYIIELAKLKQTKYRNERKLFLIEGYHLLEEAKNHNLLKTVLITNKEDFIDGVENILVNESIINKLASTKTPQGIIGVARMASVTEIKGQRFLLLDNIQDPGNLGTIIRTAAGLAIDMIIVNEGCASIYNDKTIRATQGALFKVPVIKKDLSKAIDYFRNLDIPILGTDVREGVNIKTMPKLWSYALLLGSESAGVSKDLLEKTDHNIFIEMSSGVESLNVAIAGAIIIFHLNNN